MAEKEWKDMNDDEKRDSLADASKIILDDKGISKLATYGFVEASEAYGPKGSEGAYHLYSKQFDNGDFDSAFRRAMKKTRQPGQRYSGSASEQESIQIALATTERALMASRAEDVLKEIGYSPEKETPADKTLYEKVRGKLIKELDEDIRNLIVSKYHEYRANAVVAEGLLELNKGNANGGLEAILEQQEKIAKFKKEKKEKQEKSLKEMTPEDLEF